ncbi:MAG: transcriptional regulator [Candidatus Syntrophosphaera sp.]|nr:transcriptional regulator [Candidatus Syntrophosphaera sp.]
MDLQSNLVRIASLDSVANNPARLMILFLLERHPSLDYTGLMELTRLSSGNLTTHLAKLVQAKYIARRKSFLNNKPHTSYKLTEKGRNAYERWGEQILYALPQKQQNGLREQAGQIAYTLNHYPHWFWDVDLRSRFSSTQGGMNLLPPLSGILN